MLTVELESKYIAADPTAFARLMRAENLSGFQLASAGDEHVTDRYVDTAERDVYRSGYALRIREGDGRRLVTLKARGDADGAIHEREEVEAEITLGAMPHEWPDPLRSRVQALTEGRPLHPLVTIRQQRANRTISLASRDIGVLTFDVVAYEAGGERRVTNEVEVEVGPQGTRDDLRTLDLVLQREGLKPMPLSKFERVLRFADNLADPAGIAVDAASMDVETPSLEAWTPEVSAERRSDAWASPDVAGNILQEMSLDDDASAEADAAPSQEAPAGYSRADLRPAASNVPTPPSDEDEGWLAWAEQPTEAISDDEEWDPWRGLESVLGRATPNGDGHSSPAPPASEAPALDEVTFASPDMLDTPEEEETAGPRWEIVPGETDPALPTSDVGVADAEQIQDAATEQPADEAISDFSDVEEPLESSAADAVADEDVASEAVTAYDDQAEADDLVETDDLPDAIDERVDVAPTEDMDAQEDMEAHVGDEAPVVAVEDMTNDSPQDDVGAAAPGEAASVGQNLPAVTATPVSAGWTLDPAAPLAAALGGALVVFGERLATAAADYRDAGEARDVVVLHRTLRRIDGLLDAFGEHLPETHTALGNETRRALNALTPLHDVVLVGRQVRRYARTLPAKQAADLKPFRKHLRRRKRQEDHQVVAFLADATPTLLTQLRTVGAASNGGDATPARFVLPALVWSRYADLMRRDADQPASDGVAAAYVDTEAFRLLLHLLQPAAEDAVAFLLARLDDVLKHLAAAPIQDAANRLVAEFAADHARADVLDAFGNAQARAVQDAVSTLATPWGRLAGQPFRSRLGEAVAAL